MAKFAYFVMMVAAIVSLIRRDVQGVQLFLLIAILFKLDMAKGANS